MNLFQIFNMKEEEICKEFMSFAKDKGINYEYAPNRYLWIKQNSNVCLTAHLDTVGYGHTDKEIVDENGLIKAYRNNNRTILGADDRAGVFIIWELFVNGGTFDILLFDGEEIGGIGSTNFIETEPDLSNIKLMISLDSPFHNRYIWYGNANCYQGLFEYVDSFGFVNDGHGIFTDITILTEYYDIPAINLSVGYRHQHTDEEYLDVESMYMTMRKLKRMLDENKQYSFNKIKPKLEPLDDLEEDWYGRNNSDTYQTFW